MSAEEILTMKVEMKNLTDLTNKVLNEQSETNKVQKQLAESNVRLSTEIGHLVTIVEKNTANQEKMKDRQDKQGERITRIEERISWMDRAKFVLITAGVGAVITAVTFAIKGGA